MKIVAVTACIAGLAHTYMAATALKNTAKKKGYKIKVETQGSLGVKNKLSKDDVEEADVVILACDTRIKGTERFDGKTILEVGVSDAVKSPDKVLEQAIEKLEK